MHLYYSSRSKNGPFAVVLLLIVCVFFAPYTKAQNSPVYAAIDHIEFLVTDIERALTFYTHLFGNELWKNKQTERRYLVLGASYMALEQRSPARIDHVCFGINQFDIATVHSFLDGQGIVWQDYPSGNDLWAEDHDKIRIQLGPNNSWTQLSQSTALPETYIQNSPPIFKAIAIDEIFVNVSNMEVDSLYYARLLDQTGILQAGSLWFRVGNARLRLTQVPVGQSPGINYFSVLVSTTDLAAAAEAVFAAGGIIETILADGFSFWDPDGHRVVVRTTPKL